VSVPVGEAPMTLAVQVELERAAKDDGVHVSDVEVGD
jgi:hypothetical protein